ncbi:hypothetical protein H0E87_010723 [Populus deltoides]|uniref:Uncharacterized protein n=1 Tax=Populus deltoides TaxID=3696 RepID=A0A8T2YUI0_POPDE|nr:hypothetical protein H0E87_010723 [Populus deltoides]
MNSAGVKILFHTYYVKLVWTRNAQHNTASNGSQHRVVLLLEHGVEHGVDPNIKDSEGNFPIWEALQGNHKSVIKLLSDNGATISYGDMGHFAFTADVGKLELHGWTPRALADHHGQEEIQALFENRM